jgi:Anti-sigma-K factor rskA
MSDPRATSANICETLQPLLVAYALGDASLDASARAHMLVCGACQRALHQYAAVARALTYDVTEAQPSPELRGRLIQAVTSELDTEAPTPLLALPPPAAVSAPRPQRRAGLWGAMAAALAILIAMVSWGVSLQQQVDRLTAQVQTSREGWQTMIILMNDPTVQVQRLAGDTATGTFWGAPQGQVACIMAENLPALAEGHVYQVWLRTTGGWVSAGTFPVRAGHEWFMIRPAQTIASYDGVLVTSEPSGGSAAPTGPALLQSDLAIGHA